MNLLTLLFQTRAFFVHFVITTGIYLAKLSEHVLRKHTLEHSVIKEKHRSIPALGCLAHVVHLLHGDILECTSVKSFLMNVIDVKTIRNNHILQALFHLISCEKNLKVENHYNSQGNYFLSRKFTG